MCWSRRWDGFVLFAGFTFLLWTGLAAGQEKQPAARPLFEFWEAINLQGSHVGWASGVFRKASEGMIQGDEEMHLTLTRFGQVMKMDFRIGMTETELGQVRRFSIRQTLGRDGDIVRNGGIE